MPRTIDHSPTLCPERISKSRYIAALKVFGESIGLDPANTFFPMILDGDSIHASMVVPREDGGKQLVPNVGNQTSVLAALVKIEVV